MEPEELDKLYGEHLMRALRPPQSSHVVAWQARLQLIWMETAVSASIDPAGAERTWIWSDLHLEHAEIIRHGDRPHRDVHAMNAMLLSAWRERVGDDETIVCLGDITLVEPSAQILSKLSTMPGRKLLVAGNHDFVPAQEWPKTYGFDATAPTLVCNSEPTLLLTHEPLETVPPGCVNVHGHVHGAGREVSPRHVNVCVERTGYEPLRLSDVIDRARRERSGQKDPRDESGTDDGVPAGRRPHRNRQA